MGAACLTFCLSDLDAGNWIDIAAIVINAILAVWIIMTIQNNLANKRVLKDHFINEVKDLQNEFKIFFKSVDSSSLEVKDVIPWFKLMNVRIIDLMEHTKKYYKSESSFFSVYQTELRNMTTDCPEYINQYRIGGLIPFSDATKLEYFKFQQDNLKLFNKLIVHINNA